MITFRKLAAAPGTGQVLREYLCEGADNHRSSLSNRTQGGPTPARLASYYAGNGAAVFWRRGMPANVAAVLGIDAGSSPRGLELDRLFEARRGNDGSLWSELQRKVSAYDFTAAPHKSNSLAIEFAADPGEAAALRAAVRQANNTAMQFIAGELGWARRGGGGRDGADRGEVGWVSFVHSTARPTLPIQDGRHGQTLVVETAVAGDPHHHIHNALFNVVVTADGHIGSLDTRRLTRTRLMLFGAVFQAALGQELRRLGITTEVDGRGEAVVLPRIPERAVAAFSKGRQHTLAAAKAEAKRQGLDWASLSARRKIGFANAAAVAGRLAKTDGNGDRESWRATAACIGWQHRTVIDAPRTAPLDRATWLERAYETAASAVAADFATEAVIDHERIRLHAARAFMAHGMSSLSDIDVVTAEVETRGIRVAGRPAALIFVRRDGQVKVTHTRQIEIEVELVMAARRAAADYRGALSAEVLSVAIDNAGLRLGGEVSHGSAQAAAVHILGSGPALSVLMGVAGSGKTTLLRPLVAAYRDDRQFAAEGRNVIGVAVAWRQAEALRAAGIQRIYALQPLLMALDSGQLRPDRNTVVIIDEVSQVPPAAMLKLLTVQVATGFTIRALGDPEQCQAIEAGDTMELLRRVLPREHMPELLTAVRQRRSRERLIAALFRDGRAEEALRMKREDGTARLLGGDYDQLIDEIAELYLHRRDALASRRSCAEGPMVTISALTNEDAGSISRAIRRHLRSRGEIAGEELTCRVVDSRGITSDLPIAAGDELRLFRRVHGTGEDGTKRLVGCNGDLVRVLEVRSEGLRLRSKAGRIAEVEWWRLADAAGRGLLLGPGYCLTVDAAQGITATEHINALPRGSAGATGFKSYVAESRHTETTYTLISEAAVREAELAARAVGDDRPITPEDLWRRVARDMSAKPRKALATDLVRDLRAAVMRGGIITRRMEANAAASSGLAECRSALLSDIAARVARVEEITGSTVAALDVLCAEISRVTGSVRPTRRLAEVEMGAGEAVSVTSSPSPSI